jgi:hypothetical protein
MIEIIKYIRLTNDENHAAVNYYRDDRGFKVTRHFETTSTRKIYAVDRNNLKAPIPTSNSVYKNRGRIYVATTYTFLNADMAEVVMILEKTIQCSKYDNSKLYSIQKSMLQNVDKDKFSCRQTFSACHVESFDEDALNGVPGVYSYSVDTLFTTDSSPFFLPHPFSEEGRIVTDLSKQGVPDKTSGMFIEILQSDKKLSDRYIYVAGKIVKVAPKLDTSREEGVYLTTIENDTVHDETGFRTSKIETTRLTIEEAQTAIGLYPDMESAMTKGNPEKLLDMKLGEMTMQLNEAKLDLQRATVLADTAKREQEILDLESKQRIADLTRQIEEQKQLRADKYDEVKQKRNDYYEERSYVRKDSNDAWKFISTVAITALGVYAATVKANSK